jgi:hypothetical protein
MRAANPLLTMRRSLLASSFATLFLLTGCSVGVGPIDVGAGIDGGPAPTHEAGSFVFPDADLEAAPPAPDAGSCDPPDMLVLLDRSDSMSASVGTQGTRIALAIDAINAITKAPTDTAVRFGLQVLPAIGGAVCSTQLVVPMGLGNGAKIAQSLATMSPQLDLGTPIGAALDATQKTFAQNGANGRKQYVLLITDGGECCGCSTAAYDVGVTQQLAAAGVETFVVGFGGDDDPTLLNDLACAGHTASNFATDCTCTSAGCQASSSVNPTTTPLYFKASDGPALKKALASITNQTCCNCNVPPN